MIFQTKAKTLEELTPISNIIGGTVTMKESIINCMSIKQSLRKKLAGFQGGMNDYVDEEEAEVRRQSR